ncbi:MAG TPA: hypothetical protein VNT26_13735, partial [Candidatus Sulfotelmatobacter sp.]|nr:hypothetical protein [Candidatus Sulfotelmatobacter sp.]
ASNPIVDSFREKPCEHRVAIAPLRAGALNYLYSLEWVQHLFLYYNIQSLDVVQMPRPPQDLTAFKEALAFDNTPSTLHHIARQWQLTNTRFLVAPASALETFNQQLDTAQHRFRIVQRFEIAPKPDVPFDATNPETWTAGPATNGSYAVFEFTGALPRARLFAQWQVNTNDTAVLQALASQSFDPEQSVFVAEGAPAPSGPAADQAAGLVEFESYAPKHIVLTPNAATPAVLLLNDKYDPAWKVTVDGQPAKLLRCNFIMRGVYLPKGQHRVTFRFEPSLEALYVSLAGIGVGVLLCGCLLVIKDQPEPGLRPAEPKAGQQRRTKK